MEGVGALGTWRGRGPRNMEGVGALGTWRG